ncbi:MAG: hypothetical protein ABL932_14950, partial [Terricaulis sp.]
TMIDDPNLPPAAIEDDSAAKPSTAEPLKSVLLNSSSEDDERDALTPADYAAAGVAPPDWANDPVPAIETWRVWQSNQTKALEHKRALAAKK